MPVDAFIYFEVPKGVGMLKPEGETLDEKFSKFKAFEIKEFSFDVENPTTIGSATSGAGSGKIKFNEFNIKKPTDSASTLFFKNCALGAHYSKVVLSMRKSGGSAKSAGKPYLIYTFATVFTTKIEWSGPGDEGPEDSITFAYGEMGISYFKQKEDGTMEPVKSQGWSQVTNKALDLSPPAVE